MRLCRSINYYTKRLGNIIETWLVTMEMDEPFYFPNYTQQHLPTLMACTPSPIPSPVAHGRAGVAGPASPTYLGHSSQPSSPGTQPPSWPSILILSVSWLLTAHFLGTFMESGIMSCLQRDNVSWWGQFNFFIIFRTYFKLKILLKTTFFQLKLMLGIADSPPAGMWGCGGSPDLDGCSHQQSPVPLEPAGRNWLQLLGWKSCNLPSQK